RAAVLELLTREDQTLLIRRDPLLILDLRLHVVDGVRGLHLQGDGLTRHCDRRTNEVRSVSLRALETHSLGIMNFVGSSRSTSIVPTTTSHSMTNVIIHAIPSLRSRSRVESPTTPRESSSSSSPNPRSPARRFLAALSILYARASRRGAERTGLNENLHLYRAREKRPSSRGCERRLAPRGRRLRGAYKTPAEEMIVWLFMTFYGSRKRR
ncbi:hypothetical protein BE221DRAFT_60765, partial [Ostreococcus tauri]